MRTVLIPAKTLVILLVLALFTAPLSAAQSPERRLVDGTKFSVRLLEPLTSATADEGQAVTFEVIDDVLVDNVVVIKQGTPVKGAIIDAQAKRRMGRAGKLSYTVTETRSVERQPIKLRATQERSGGSHVAGVAVATAAIAVFVPVAAPFALLRKGKDITIPAGTRIDVFVDGDHILAAAEPGTVSASAASSTSSAPLMTNADVIKLHAAGFADDLIVARIVNSVSHFDLQADALIALKNAGISEKLITAMLQAKS